MPGRRVSRLILVWWKFFVDGCDGTLRTTPFLLHRVHYYETQDRLLSAYENGSNEGFVVHIDRHETSLRLTSSGGGRRLLSTINNERGKQEGTENLINIQIFPCDVPN